MATTAASPAPQPALTLDSISSIDMTTLTHSELLSLSRLFSSPSSPSSSLPPSIDPSAFNESAGSRRQTFSRRRVAVAGRRSSSTHSSAAAAANSEEEPHRRENRSIIGYLKEDLRNLPEFYDLDFDYSPPPIVFPERSSGFDLVGQGKRKRGRKPKPKVPNPNPNPYPSYLAGEGVKEEERLEIVNKNGLAVDVVGFGSREDPYGEEIRRRTEGMGSEEELFGFLRDLGGEWCSRRRKRKVVDAGVLGDALPVGWKLLLGLKRKGGHAWVYCRRYIRLVISCLFCLIVFLGLFG